MKFNFTYNNVKLTIIMLMLCEPHPSTHAQIAAPASGSSTRHVGDSCLLLSYHRRRKGGGQGAMAPPDFLCDA